MNRKLYIYAVVPCFTLLSCLPALSVVLGAMFGSVIGWLLILFAWGLVWMRLYSNASLRPEFSTLAILPLACFLLLYSADASIKEVWTGPTWQNLYSLLWIFAALVGCASMRLSATEKKQLKQKDLVGPVMMALCAVYAFFTWLTSYNQLFITTP